MVLYLVLAALGGLWMPVQILPSPLQTVAKTLPSYHLAQLGWHIARGVAPAFGDAPGTAGVVCGRGPARGGGVAPADAAHRVKVALAS